uniref:Regulator of G-protein signaling 1 n=1 Tax=Gasterosteus aculeatus TaxID=69293 RepID=G3PUH9_GASAC
PKDPLEDVETWSESVDKVLSCKAGQIAFREFLKSEYSEENILFWIACEEYKKIKTTPEMISSANRIYSEFVQTEAPRQINIDCGTRENITKNISQPSLTSFDSAQKLIYSLMARDCYPRFLKSHMYQGLLRRNDSSDQEDKTTTAKGKGENASALCPCGIFPQHLSCVGSLYFLKRNCVNPL